MPTIQAKEYTILKNAVGELLLVLESFGTPPDNDVRVLYDGGEHALFYRNKDRTIVLDYIHPEVRANLAAVKEIYVGELKGEVLEFDYMAKLELVKKIPDVDRYITEKPDVGKALAKFQG